MQRELTGIAHAMFASPRLWPTLDDRRSIRKRPQLRPLQGGFGGRQLGPRLSDGLVAGCAECGRRTAGARKD